MTIYWPVHKANVNGENRYFVGFFEPDKLEELQAKMHDGVPVPESFRKSKNYEKVDDTAFILTPQQYRDLCTKNIEMRTKQFQISDFLITA